VLAMIAGPAFSPAAQKKDDLVSIQRDVADLAFQVKQLQKSQDEKMQAIQGLVQQSMEASAKVTGSLAALQTSLTNSVSQALADQQKKNNEQHADTTARLDTLTQTQGAIGETVSQLSTRLKDMNAKLDNLNELVKTLNAPPAVPPPPPASQTTAPGAPAGWSAVQTYNTARADYTAGRYDIAITGFLDYIKYAPHDDENAPNAQYYIAQSYRGLKQYDDAAQAFADVVDKFAANPKTCESRYMKGVSLEDAKHREDALSAFHEFQTACPADVNRDSAKEHIAHLSGPARANNKSKGKGK
jgi:TolA-binding protein